MHLVGRAAGRFSKRILLGADPPDKPSGCFLISPLLGRAHFFLHLFRNRPTL